MRAATAQIYLQPAPDFVAVYHITDILKSVSQHLLGITA